MKPLDWLDAQAALGGGAPFGESAPPAAAPDTVMGAQELEALLGDLNEPQRRAVTHEAGGLLILAGAGSGKTRVITRRVAWLVGSGRAAPWEVLAITFTNKAAREMRERVARLLPVSGLWISTFHAMCARILRRDVELLGDGRTRSFSIYDTADKNQLVKTITKELGYDTQRFRPAMLSGWISQRKNEAASGEESGWEADGFGVEEEVCRAVFERYQRALAEHNAYDFDDLQLAVLELFEGHPGARDAYARRFKYVLVDEYQDTNRVQYLLTRHLAGHHGNLAVCGDPDQSIYAWRGADISNILDFEEDFSRRGGAVEVVKLEQNYRSIPSILKAAQGLIRHNVGRKEKDLWTAREDERKVGVVACGSEDDEAARIAEEVHGLRREGVRLDGIAILFRVNFMQRALERALRLAAVPYQIVGGVEFYARREIRDLLAYLHLIVNPADDVACGRILNVPARGIGEKSLGLLRAWAGERGVPLLAAAGSQEARAGIRGRAKGGLAAFAGLFDQLSDLAGRPAAEAVQRVIDETDYFGWLSSMNDAAAAGREENVQELLAHAETYDRDEPEGRLRGFLQDVALVSDVDGWSEDTERVTLMTLHAAKGLEFPAVIIAGLEEELLPHARAVAEGDSGVEEERRLLYVGMTRAQDRLLLTHAQTRMYFGETSWRKPSRFLDELPPEFVEGADEDEPEDEERVLGSWEEPAATPGLCEGARVEHDHFGAGRVTRVQGAGANARVTVEFAGVGAKILLVQYANLRVIP